jgi:hypothetical protein
LIVKHHGKVLLDQLFEALAGLNYKVAGVVILGFQITLLKISLLILVSLRLALRVNQP